MTISKFLAGIAASIVLSIATGTMLGIAVGFACYWYSLTLAWVGMETLTKCF